LSDALVCLIPSSVGPVRPFPERFAGTAGQGCRLCPANGRTGGQDVLPREAKDEKIPRAVLRGARKRRRPRRETGRTPEAAKVRFAASGVFRRKAAAVWGG